MRKPFSSFLGDMAGLLERGQFPLALQKADEMLARPELTPHQRARILALVADSEKRRGEFQKAAALYTRSATMLLDDHRLWVRPVVGQVETLLKACLVKDAHAAARHACSVAEAKFKEFDEYLKRATRYAGGQIAVVEGRPMRPSVVASRMAHIFLKEGELDIAQELFERAVSLSKHGACKARQGLAQIMLARGRFNEALERAEDAIRVGRYQAKTLGAWPIVIRARSALGGGRISERLLKGLHKANPSVRARAIRLIVSELRQAGMPQWKTVAVTWLEREGNAFPIVAAELKKMILASWKTVPGYSAEKKAAAQRVLTTPQLGPREWLAAAKEYVRCSLWGKQAVNISSLLNTARKKYGNAFVAQARHGLALSCMLAKRHDLARPLLEQNILDLPASDEQRSKSAWALARMESVLGNHERAANVYRMLYENPSTPPRFAVQARLLGLREMLKTGDRIPLHQLRNELESLLSGVDDVVVLMDAARHVRLHVPGLRVWSEELFQKASQRALSTFWETQQPGRAMEILLKVARCEVYDFDLAADTVRFWEQLPEEKRLWLWSQDRCYWQYLGCVALAYTRLNNEREIRRFAWEWFDDPATPPEGWVEIGIPTAEWLIQRGQSFVEGMDVFDEILKRAPRHPLVAKAWYWKALIEHKKGNAKGRDRCCRALREAQGVSGGLLSEWELDARALLLLAGLDFTRMDSQAVNYTREFLQSQQDGILRDLEKIP